MIVKTVNRFTSNFGVAPNSITLKHNWTTPIGASNIEENGPSFFKDSDFGDGLGGLVPSLVPYTSCDASIDPNCVAANAPGTSLPSFLGLSNNPTVNTSDYISALMNSSTVDSSEQAAPNSIYNYIPSLSTLAIVGGVGALVLMGMSGKKGRHHETSI